MHRNFFRALFSFLMDEIDRLRGRTMNAVLRLHLRANVCGAMWLPLHQKSDQMPHAWGKSGYFLILDEQGWLEVWRCENWHAHMVSLTPWDESVSW